MHNPSERRIGDPGRGKPTTETKNARTSYLRVVLTRISKRGPQLVEIDTKPNFKCIFELLVSVLCGWWPQSLVGISRVQEDSARNND